MSTAFAGSVIDPIDDKYIDQRQMVSEGGPLGPENFHDGFNGDSEAPADTLEPDLEADLEDIDEEYQRQRRMVWEGGPLGPENYHW
ncbi:hypothetical protein ACXZ66_12910 [Corynebacterium sp. S7]